MVAKRAQVSWLRGVESVISKCGKFEIDALVDRELVKMLKDDVRECSLKIKNSKVFFRGKLLYTGCGKKNDPTPKM